MLRQCFVSASSVSSNHRTACLSASGSGDAASRSCGACVVHFYRRTPSPAHVLTHSLAYPPAHPRTHLLTHLPIAYYRQGLACVECHRAKAACQGYPCTRCVRLGKVCVPPNPNPNPNGQLLRAPSSLSTHSPKRVIWGGRQRGVGGSWRPRGGKIAGLHVHILHMCMHMHTCTSACTRAYVRTCIRAYVHMHMHMSCACYMCIRAYVHMCI